MQSEIDKNLSECGNNSYKRKVIKDLEKKLLFTRDKISEMMKRREENNNRIAQIKIQIERICTSIDCDLITNSDLLGNNGVTESNMFVYMGMIE